MHVIPNFLPFRSTSYGSWDEHFLKNLLNLTLFDLFTLCDLNIWPNDYYLISNRQGVTYVYLPPKFWKKLLKNCKPYRTYHEMAKISPFLTLRDLIIWLIHYLVSRRQGLIHTYLPPKFWKISIKIATGREVLRIVLWRGWRWRRRQGKQGWIQSIYL